MAEPIPVVFDWDYNQIIGAGHIIDDKLVITVESFSHVDQLRQFMGGSIKAVSLGFMVQHNIEYKPQEEIDGA